ncbi:hypothetical protein ILYODFUR_036666 [Ilyodon furcidens]|uniref:Uncharacterized protein n=1 Tax=Ilyodon furcidens TaxID=33524 RepID=A0ABV0UQ56_9TELE
MRRHGQQWWDRDVNSFTESNIFRTLSCRGQLLIIYVSTSPLNSSRRRLDPIQRIRLQQEQIITCSFF